ncbi:MAG: S26 family signal peptidase [Haloarculaceae archaeon]
MGFAYDVLTSVLAVLLVGGFLFAVSGVWPPLVAVESGSMIPNMHQGDLVFVMEEHRFAGDGAVADTGVVTAASGGATEYRTFGGYGDVIVYSPDGNVDRTPIIHRAILWVEKGERWFDEADSDDVPGHVSSCAELQNCPAPHAGFITKGDNNGEYDQANGLSAPVRPEWVVGTAEIRLPGLGWIRLGTS